MTGEIDRILAAHRKELDTLKAEVTTLEQSQGALAELLGECEQKVANIQRLLRMPIREEGPAGSNPPPAP